MKFLFIHKVLYEMQRSAFFRSVSLYGLRKESITKPRTPLGATYVKLSTMNQRFSGKVAIVTASTEGIGLAIAKRLAAEGASVVVSSRKQPNVDQAVEQLKKVNQNITGVVCHVGKGEDRKKLIDHVTEKYGGIDILVSNAAVNPVMCQVLDTPEQAWDKIFDINVKSAFMLTKEIVPHMERRGGGAIVYVASIAAYQPTEVIGAYSVSKTTLLGLTKAVALQCVSQNIRVNCLCPGIIQTKFSESLWSNPSSKEILDVHIPMKRIGTPEECAGAVAFLCSDDASYITGEAITVAGGYFSHL